jgi:CheY-like chemotaxis protein
MKVLIAIHDLIFASKVRETARLQGAEIEEPKTKEPFIHRARTQRPDVVFVDLNDPAVEPIALITEMRGDPALRQARIVGFTHHHLQDARAAAEKAGCDLVLTRNEFSKRLPELLGD